MSRDSGGVETRPTDCRIGILTRSGVLGLFPFYPVHIRVLALEDFLFPFLHSIEEYLQAYGVDSAALVEIPVWKAVKESTQPII